jgi:hypothetical protein
MGVIPDEGCMRTVKSVLTELEEQVKFCIE